MYKNTWRAVFLGCGITFGNCIKSTTSKIVFSLSIKCGWICKSPRCKSCLKVLSCCCKPGGTWNVSSLVLKIEGKCVHIMKNSLHKLITLLWGGDSIPPLKGCHRKHLLTFLDYFFNFPGHFLPSLIPRFF